MFENIENLNKTASIAVSAFGVEGKAVFVQISENLFQKMGNMSKK